MTTKLKEKKHKILRIIFGTLSFSTAVFVFQACYGTPEDFGMDVEIKGYLKSKATNQPIPGIKVSLENQPQYELTDSEGMFKIYASKDSSYKVMFEDIDSTTNGSFLPKDTVVSIIDDTTFLNVALDAK